MLSASDLAAYLHRLGWTGAPPRADLASLQRLVALHTAAIPFENLTPWIGQPVRLARDALLDKLVHQQRGGYCFEHNGLFLAVLETLGFQAERLAARVLWGLPAPVSTPRTHRALRVWIDGDAWLADVGFGGLTMTAAIRLVPDLAQPTPLERFRLQHHPDDLLGDWHLQAEIAGAGTPAWHTLYRFSLAPQDALDDEMASHFTATHPASRFVLNLVAARALPDRRLALLNRELRVHRPGQESELHVLADAGALRQRLVDDFGLRLPTDPRLDERLAALFDA
jgi:N-hydroxyarylamine O-acetyltransferase